MTPIARTHTPPPLPIDAHNATQHPVFGPNPTRGPQ
jgi:hypothetical protein